MSAQAENARGLRRIDYGTVPSIAYLAIVCEREGIPAPAKSVQQLHAIMTHELRTHGATQTLGVLLERCGFEWRAPDREVSP
jgi:hypothetical protein